MLQGSSNARYVASRLIPAHRDGTEEQEAQVPVLGALTEEQLAAMLSRQLPTEEASLLQWCRLVGVEPPPPPDNITDALEGKSVSQSHRILTLSSGGDEPERCTRDCFYQSGMSKC